MGDVGSARYEPALLPPCPTVRVLSYSNCQRSTHAISTYTHHYQPPRPSLLLPLSLSPLCLLSHSLYISPISLSPLHTHTYAPTETHDKVIPTYILTQKEREKAREKERERERERGERAGGVENKGIRASSLIHHRHIRIIVEYSVTQINIILKSI